MALISVIVPVYRAEGCLERCVESILSQSHFNLELILVEDGSPDESGALCDRLAEKDSRIRVIHQENKGAAAARNAGLDLATGKFVSFVDSDDMVSSDWLAHLLEQTGEGRQLPLCSHCGTKEQLGKEKELSVEAKKVYPAGDYLSFLKAGIAGFLWNGLFSREVLESNHLRLREQNEKGDYNEDLIFCLSYLRQMESVCYVGYSDYLYDVHSDSLSHSYQSYYFDKFAEKFSLWLEFVREMNPQATSLQNEVANHFRYYFFQALQLAFDAGEAQTFRRIILSKEMEQLMSLAEFPEENPKVVSLLKGRKAKSLWLFYQLHKIKQKIVGQ